jgi:replicative DNA helicase
VDYLQLMRSSNRRAENRNQEIGEIARALKQIAREFNVPVLVLSQLSRSIERRENKRPMLSDLRDSGSIEAEADVVLFIHREEYYGDREAPPPDRPAARLCAPRRGGTHRRQAAQRSHRQGHR